MKTLIPKGLNDMERNKFRTWCDVSVDNVLYNFNQFKRIAPNSKIMCVVKSDAYGHGACELATDLENAGADAFAVAFAEEAIQLRNKGIKAQIMILGVTPIEWIALAVENDITFTVYNYENALEISNIAKALSKQAKIHIKVDTGMGRIGFIPNDESLEEIIKISKLPNICIEGMFTHFACADEEDTSYVEEQFEKYTDFVSKIEALGIKIEVKHVCNSAAAMRFPKMHLDMIRVGISLYGLYPSEIKYDLDLKPAMQMKSKVINVKKVPAGTKISYGSIFEAKEDMVVATVAAGYADGYSRTLTNKAKVIVGNTFAPVIGRICMDQCMIDATNVNNISVGDEVILFGGEKDLCISADEVAYMAGTIGYEILCSVTKRVPRRYFKRKKVAGVLNSLLPDIDID